MRSLLPKIALAPTGRILLFSRYPAMLGVCIALNAWLHILNFLWML